MKRALCLWLPNWPLQRLAAARAELRSRAVVLYHWHAQSSARVVAYAPRLENAAALAFSGQRADIRPGMTLAEAASFFSLAQEQARSEGERGARRQADLKQPAARREPRPPGGNIPDSNSRPLLHELHDPLADQLALSELAEACACFSPSVGLEESQSPESLLLDVTGLGRLSGDEPALARQVARFLARRHLSARVAIAPTPGAAWALAHFGVPRSASAASWRVPVVVPGEDTWAALAPLPIEALRLSPETCGLLAALGLRRIDEVVALPRSTLLARFGPEVLLRLDQAKGAATETIASRAPVGELSLELPFEHPTARREMLDRALVELVAQICETLAQQQRGVLRLQCRFEFEGAPARWFVVGMYRPTAAERHVSDLVRLKWEGLKFRAPVTSLRVTVLASDRLDFHQQDLFERGKLDSQAARRSLTTLVDRLGNRLGSHAVVRPQIVPDAQPEYACHEQPLAALANVRPKKSAAVSTKPARTRVRQSNSQPPSSQSPAPSPQPLLPTLEPLLPVFLESAPRRLAVTSVLPEGPPVQFVLAGQIERIVRCWGPERIETGWWRSRIVRRDYYQVETATGARFWLYRELASGDWFLHGEFG